MRPSLLLSLLLAGLLSACASNGNRPVSKQIAQSGALKVHPGLLGQPVPDELKGPQTIAAQQVADAPIKMDEEGLRAQRSVYFDLDKAEMRADYDPILQAHARYLAAHPAAKIRIEGNADDRGPADYNRRLGMKRAQTVRATLIGHGAGSAQVNVKTLGETKPKLLGRNEESWAENRRADVIYEREK